MPPPGKATAAEAAVGIGGELGFIRHVIVQERPVGTFLDQRIVTKWIVHNHSLDRYSSRTVGHLPVDPDSALEPHLDLDRLNTDRVSDHLGDFEKWLTVDDDFEMVLLAFGLTFDLKSALGITGNGSQPGVCNGWTPSGMGRPVS